MVMDQRITATLDSLHQEAKGDRWKIARGIPAVSHAAGKSSR